MVGEPRGDHRWIANGKNFEICVSGTYFSGIWFHEFGGHVSGRHNFPF